MDPNATLAEIVELLDKPCYDYKVEQLSVDLITWILNGGFQPEWARFVK